MISRFKQFTRGYKKVIMDINECANRISETIIIMAAIITTCAIIPCFRCQTFNILRFVLLSFSCRWKIRQLHQQPPKLQQRSEWWPKLGNYHHRLGSGLERCTWRFGSFLKCQRRSSSRCCIQWFALRQGVGRGRSLWKLIEPSSTLFQCQWRKYEVKHLGHLPSITITGCRWYKFQGEVRILHLNCLKIKNIITNYGFGSIQAHIVENSR